MRNRIVEQHLHGRSDGRKQMVSRHAEGQSRLSANNAGCIGAAQESKAQSLSLPGHTICPPNPYRYDRAQLSSSCGQNKTSSESQVNFSAIPHGFL